MARHEEYQYLDLLDYILKYGNEKQDRTGVGTKSMFGAQMRFSLRDQFPILTTKKVFFRGVVEELLWFLRGQTDSKILEAKNVNIWKGNTSADFLKNHNPPLRYPEGEAGPNYSWQWRNWNGTYEAKAEAEYVQKDYKDGGYAFVPTNEKFVINKQNNGIDQIAQVIEAIKDNPDSRRHIVTAWNPEQLDAAALPPCHILFQFYVSNGELSCMFTMRSNDLFLGCPFNISSYALLTYIMADLTGLRPGELIYSSGDTHIYLNHQEQCKLQLTREPYPFPKLFIKRRLDKLQDIDKLEFEDFELTGYQAHPAIKADMAV